MGNCRNRQNHHRELGSAGRRSSNRQELGSVACIGPICPGFAARLPEPSRWQELAFLRITTPPSLGRAAAAATDAFAFLQALRRDPMAVRIEPGPDHDGIFHSVPYEHLHQFFDGLLGRYYEYRGH